MNNMNRNNHINKARGSDAGHPAPDARLRAAGERPGAVQQVDRRRHDRRGHGPQRAPAIYIYIYICMYVYICVYIYIYIYSGRGRQIHLLVHLCASASMRGRTMCRAARNRFFTLRRLIDTPSAHSPQTTWVPYSALTDSKAQAVLPR